MRPLAAAIERRPLLACLLVTLWLGLESLALGPYSYLPITEFADGPFSCMAALWSGPRGPGPHYWLPSVACGIDRLANNLMYPQGLSLLLWALPDWAAFQAFIFIHFFFSCYFTLRLCTDSLKSSAQAGLLAGFAVAMLNPFTGGLGSSVFPFVLWAFDRVLDMDLKRGLLASALLGVFFSVFASAVVSIPFCLVWALFWFSIVRPRPYGHLLALGGILGAFAAAPQLQELWAMWVNVPGSHRAGWSAPWACTVPELGRALLQGLAWARDSCGVTAAVALLGLLGSGLRSGPLRGTSAMLLLTAAASGAGEWVKTCLGLDAGPLNGLHFHRFFLILPLAGALAAAAGLQALERGRAWVLTLAMAVLFCQSAYSKSKTLWDYWFQGGYTANYRSPALDDLAARWSPTEPFRVATFTHGLVPGYAAAYGLETVDGYINMYPRSYFNFWRKVIEPVIDREPYLEEYFGRWGNQLYLFLHSVDDWPGGVLFADHYRLPLLSLANTRYIISRHPLEDPNFRLLTPQKPWRDMSWKDRNLLRFMENFTGKRYLFIYENLSALPRAFLARSVKTWPDEVALWTAMGKASIDELRDTVHAVAGRGPAAPPKPGFRKGGARVTRYQTDRLDLEVDLDGPGILVVSNSFNPFWTCRVDGAARPIFPADGAFWGVLVGKGDRKVTFAYSPPYRLY